jgi:hypothetical protein
VIIQVLEQRGLDVISERGRDVGDGADDPAEPSRRAAASSTPVISSSVAPAASAWVVPHSRQTAGDPIATSTPTRTSAAVLAFKRPDSGRARASPAWSSMQLSSMIAILRRISWNLTVWPTPFPRRQQTRRHPGPEQAPAHPFIGTGR